MYYICMGNLTELKFLRIFRQTVVSFLYPSVVLADEMDNNEMTTTVVF